MKYGRLGRSGLQVSELSLGTMNLGGPTNDRTEVHLEVLVPSVDLESSPEELEHCDTIVPPPGLTCPITLIQPGGGCRKQIGA